MNEYFGISKNFKINIEPANWIDQNKKNDLNFKRTFFQKNLNSSQTIACF